jgi:SAM-dependent methyltransferase
MILQGLGMPDLNHKTKPRYRQRLHKIRKQMTMLSNDFASSIPTESNYSDAYFAYNFPMNLMKTTVIVQQIRSWCAGLFSNKRRVSVLDIGCGEGAGMLGFYYGFRNHGDVRAFDLVGIDGSRKMLRRAKALAAWTRKSDRRLKTRFLNQSIDSAYRCEPKGRFDVILLVNSLAEIIHEDVIPTQFIKAVARCLGDDGLIIIIEPALKRLAHRVMRLRNYLANQKALRVLLPCLHDSDCALLHAEKRSEWCHQSVSWSPPDFLKIINQGLNREIDILKFAYLVLAKSGFRLIRPQGHLAISQLLTEKGKKRCFLCTPAGRVELVRLNRARTSCNESFDKIKKGSVVEVKDATIKKLSYWQVKDNTIISILK